MSPFTNSLRAITQTKAEKVFGTEMGNELKWPRVGYLSPSEVRRASAEVGGSLL